MTYVIYGIIDPRSKAIFYIGETENFKKRCEQHLEGSDQLSGLMIKQIKKNGFIPQFTILEECPSEEAALMAEIAWIEFIKSRGGKLSNSQAFNGHADRQAERRALTKSLEGMQRPKYGGKRLRHIANGRTYNTGEGKGWSKKDLARLKGMKKAHMAPKTMAKLLKRPLKVVKEKLGTLPT